ncbi:hypothetical protein EYF80_011677 [Liparis tanakae]|uniref:Uncharacterized protein n=1 Tax=Liparis tanakae TaxID=230148 RepID=A0A4Z2ILU8_9TELE|nr:hypothetical protein EYF80_011677 [Liparis tanakae]
MYDDLHPTQTRAPHLSPEPPGSACLIRPRGGVKRPAGAGEKGLKELLTRLNSHPLAPAYAPWAVTCEIAAPLGGGRSVRPGFPPGPGCVAVHTSLSSTELQLTASTGTAGLNLSHAVPSVGLRLTGSNDSLDADIGSVDLFGEVPDRLVGVFVGVRVDVDPAARQLDCMGEKEEILKQIAAHDSLPNISSSVSR